MRGHVVLVGLLGALSCGGEAPPVPPFAPPPTSSATFRSLLLGGDEIGAEVALNLRGDRITFYDVTPGGPSYVAGFRAEDQVVAIDGRTWASKAEAEAVLRSVVPDAKVVRVDVERWGRTETLRIRLDDPSERPRGWGLSRRHPRVWAAPSAGRSTRRPG